MLKPVLETQPSDAVVTLAEAKRFLAIEFDEDDLLIKSLVTAATSHFDGYSGILGRALASQVWSVSFPCFQNELRLPLCPLISIDAVTYFDADNVIQTLPVDYCGYEDAGGVFVRFNLDLDFPVTYHRPDAIKVFYRVGHADLASIPENIKIAIKMLAADFYDNRGANLDGKDLMENPAYKSLLAGYRLLRI